MISKFLTLTLLYLFFGVTPAFAVTVTISDIPSAVSDLPFSFNVSVSGAQAGTNYLRANFYPADTTNYFGLTYNGSSFINSSACSDYLPITIDSSGNWSGSVQAKIDTSSSYYTGNGSYNFKVRRYTQSCSSSYTWSNELATTVSVSTPSPTPTSSPTPTPSPSSSNSSSFTISNIPSAIDSNQEFSVSADLSFPNSPNTTYYLKGVFKKQDKTNYFGITKVNNSWIRNNKSYLEQLKITTNSNGSWSGKLDLQPDILDSGYEGAGDYIFKVGKYSESGSLTWSNESSVKINAQEIIVEDTKSDILGIDAQSAQGTSSSSKYKPEEYSLDKYIKIATPASESAGSNIQVKIKDQKTNYSVWIGIITIAAGIGLFAYVYLQSSNLRETIFNIFRKRNP